MKLVNGKRLHVGHKMRLKDRLFTTLKKTDCVPNTLEVRAADRLGWSRFCQDAAYQVEAARQLAWRKDPIADTFNLFNVRCFMSDM